MPIFPLLFLLFISVPIIEIMLLLKVGAEIGILWTIFFVIFTAVLGSVLIRSQGFNLIMQSRQQMASGKVPTEAVFSGACLLVAGALLLTPGFFTDGIGFLLLTPFLRNVVYKHYSDKIKGAVIGSHNASTAGHNPNGDVFEGEFTKESSDTDNIDKKLK